MASVLVAGALANRPLNGGGAWVRLSYLLGFRRLGIDVTFLEQGPWNGDASTAKGFFADFVEQFGLAGDAALIDGDGRTVSGLPCDELLERAVAADLLLNIGGNLTWPRLLQRARRTAYLDLDPAFTQFWHAQGLLAVPDHDAYFTIGENVGTPPCAIPTNGLRWRATRPPVVLRDWPAVHGAEPAPFTTVASWRGPFGRVEHEGKRFGLKLDEFRRFVDLPRLTRHEFELALDIHPGEERDLRLLCQHGWRLADPRRAAGDPFAFRRYVQRSAAEFSVAKGIYVETDSGWFSDRTVRYLASGKPVLVQDTGFSRNLPTGEGLIAFRTLDEAVAGADAIASDYHRHSRAARLLAEEHFDSDVVLGRLLAEACA
jgi:hypothetical protein